MRTRQPEEEKVQKPSTAGLFTREPKEPAAGGFERKEPAAGGFERKEPTGKPTFSRSGKAPAKTGGDRPAPGDRP